MPPRRRSAAESLTEEDLDRLAAAVAEGRRATVYLREAVPGLDLEPGTSARVVSVSGTTVMVKPRGIDDELPYEAAELRATKNPPARPEPVKRQTSRTGSTTPRKRTATAAAPTNPSTAPATPQRDAAKLPAARSAPAAAPPAVAKPAAEKQAAPKSRATKRSPTKAGKSVSVTIYGSAANEWFVAVSRGTTKPPRARAVTPESVSAAMSALGDEAGTEAVGAVMSAAREEAERRVAELSRELEEARQALAALDSD